MVDATRLKYHQIARDFHAFVYYLIGSESSKVTALHHHKKYIAIKRKP